MMESRIGDEWQLTAALSSAVIMLLEAGVESARLDAEVLAAAAIGIPRERLLTVASPIPAEARRRFESFIARRLTREPVAYITGRKEFFSLELEVNPAVLIPRPETETAVATALELLRQRKRPAVLRVLEIGAGSGAIAVTIAVNEQRAQLVATDISSAALAVAQRNAVRHDVGERIRFAPADLWPGRADGESLFDVVISNPPYVACAAIATLAPEVARYEPRLALDGGPDGLDFYRRIAVEVGAYLVVGGHLVVEVGDEQALEVVAILRAHSGDEISTINDLAGQPRVIHARFG
jgi:release factor glutamine methyltransferase